MARTASDNYGNMGPLLTGVARCPHCGIASPWLEKVWASDGHTPRQTPGPDRYWGAYSCSACGSVVAVSATGRSQYGYDIDDMFPSAKVAHEDLPEPGRSFLQQAYETLHAPDAATLMAGSAVDSFLKAKGYSEGSLYSRIDQALADNVLTKGMADWAHWVRLGANRPRHSDADRPRVSGKEARQAVDFAEALGTFLFVLTAQIERGIEDAKGKGG